MPAPRIALDAFGGDACPGPEVEAAVAAARAGYQLLLVGDEARLGPLLERASGGAVPDGIEVVHAPDVIAMDDTPARAVRQKPEASMPRAFDLVLEGRAEAVVSAGNSGAMLACGLFKFRRIRGVDRPAICTRLPMRGGYFQLLDAGANVECRPVNLVQFAVLGAVYQAIQLGRERPRLAVLANGTEEGKGTDLTRAAHQCLREHPSPNFEYRGYIEGNMFRGDVDVVVTDGFTGNIALKVAEAAGAFIGDEIKALARGRARLALGGMLLRPAFQHVRELVHPDYYGGAPLLGVRHLAIICHGSSGARTLTTAIAQAARLVEQELTPKLTRAIEEHSALTDAAKGTEAAAGAVAKENAS